MNFSRPAFISKNILALFGSLVFGNASERVIFPLLALVFFDQHSNLFHSDASHTLRSYWYGICMALPSIASFIAAPILSCISDRYGRKKLLTLSYLGAAVSGVITSTAILTQSILLFAIGIFILGLFCRTNPIGQAVIGDITNGKNKLTNMGWLQTFIALGAFLGPIIGGYCAYWHFPQINFSSAFMLSALFGLIAAAICFVFFKETLEQPKKHISFSLVFGSIVLLKHRRTLPLAILLACGQFSWSLYYQYAPPTLKLISDFSAANLGIFTGLMAFWVMLGGSLGIGLLRKKYSNTQILTAGLILQLIGSLTILIGFYCDQAWLIWLSSIPMASGDVITFSVISTLYSNLYGKQQQGQVMGACFLNAAAIWTITGLLGGYLIAENFLLPLLITPIAIILALLLKRWFYLES